MKQRFDLKQWFHCHVMDMHRYTTKAIELMNRPGSSMTWEGKDAQEKAFEDLTNVYCKYCGKQSHLNKKP